MQQIVFSVNLQVLEHWVYWLNIVHSFHLYQQQISPERFLQYGNALSTLPIQLSLNFLFPMDVTKVNCPQRITKQRTDHRSVVIDFTHSKLRERDTEIQRMQCHSTEIDHKYFELGLSI